MKHPWQALIVGWIVVGGMLACMRSKHQFEAELTDANTTVAVAPEPSPVAAPQVKSIQSEPGKFSAQDGMGGVDLREESQAAAAGKNEESDLEARETDERDSGEREATGADLIHSDGHPLLIGLEIEKKYFPLVRNRGEHRKYSTIEGKISFEDDDQRTKSGEWFDTEEMVAASRRLPMGTIAKCTNLSNGKSVSVQIIDRGPYVNGRVLDLSEGAARKIGMIRKGVTEGRVEVIAYPQKKK